jgi:hypothetical protein
MSAAMSRLVFVAVLAAACSDSGVGGGGSGAVDDFSFEGYSSECEQYCRTMQPCYGEDPPPLSDCAEYCGLFAGCEAEANAMWACQTDYAENKCSSSHNGCNEEITTAYQCPFQNDTCEERPEMCSCSAQTFGQTITASCQLLEAEGGAASGGGGSGGGSGLTAVCQCMADGVLSHICQQSELDCHIATSCCYRNNF